MDINFTFFVQLFHFFVAYCIIERLFCRPTITALEKEKKVYTDLISTITAQQQVLAQKEQTKQDEWKRIKLFFSQSFPSLFQPKEQPKTSTKSAQVTISSHDEHTLQQTLYTLLKQRLSHVE
jgi:nitrate/TMAO reductase-like tetraheme cytochrome c subunit